MGKDHPTSNVFCPTGPGGGTYLPPSEKPYPVPPGVQVLKTNVFCPTGEGGGVDPTCSPKDSGRNYFDPKAIEAAEKESGSYKSRSLLIDMSPDDFLRMALDIPAGASTLKKDTVEGVLSKGDKFSSIPSLRFITKDGVAKTQNHEGRHRALSLKSRGVTSMPVMITGDIRWSEQKLADNFDRIRGPWPTVMKGESGGSIKFPVDDPLTTNSSPLITKITVTDEQGNEYALNQNSDGDLRQQVINSLTVNRPNPLLLDPTGTGSQRKALERAFLGRLKFLKRVIYEKIVHEDAFGLKSENQVLGNLASTQVNIIDPKITVAILDIQNRIDPDDLVKLEDDPHITIRYGLDDIDPQRVEMVISQYSPVTVKLRGLSLFEADENDSQRGGPQFDVLKIEIASPDLVQINRHLGILPNTQTHPDYHPHLTIAYLKPGTGKKYVGESGLEGTELVFKSMVYSTDDREVTELAFVGNQLTTNAGIWQFLTDSEKLVEFTDWLKTQISIGVLGTMTTLGVTDPDHWLFKQIQSVFYKGMGTAFDYLRKPELQTKQEFYQGTKAEFLRDSFLRPVSVERVKLLASRALNELSGITDKMATQMQRSLTDGFMRGDNPFTIARQLVKDVDDLSKNQAKTITRTEVARAFNEGQLESMESLGMEEVGIAVEWEVSKQGTTLRGNPAPCPICAPLKGIVLKVKEAHGLLPRHPNCVLGDSKIVSPSPLTFMRAEYTGQIIEIVTTKGRRLSVTENHVLLTHRGWVRAKEITNFDYLFHAPCLNGPIFQRPNDYLNVPSIEEVHTSFLESFGVRSQTSTNSRPEYLHGDGVSIDSKIDITDIYSKLRSDQEIKLISEFCKIKFMLGDVLSSESIVLDSQRSLSFFFLGLSAAADCFMGFSSISSVLLRGSSAHMQPVGFSDVSHFDSSLYQSVPYKQSTEAELLADGVWGESGLIELDHLIKSIAADVSSRSGREECGGFDFDSSLFEFSTEHISIALEHLRYLNQGEIGSGVKFNGLVKDRVNLALSRHVTNFPVFDLETKESIYSVNGILSSNCLCSWAPANVGEKTDQQKRTQSKIQAAVKASLKAERPKRKKTHKPSKWTGRKVRISKTRPKSIVNLPEHLQF